MTSMSELLLLTSPGDGPRHEDTSVRACARRAARAELRLRRRVTECIPLRLRAGICGTVEIREWGAQPPGGWPRLFPPRTRVCVLPLGPWALGPTLPQSPGGRAAWRAHVSTGGARRARASGTPPTPPTAAARPPPRRRRPHRASRDAPPRRRARTPRCTPAPTHMSYAWAKAARGAEEAGVKGVCVLRGRGYLRGWSLTPWQRWTG